VLLVATAVARAVWRHRASLVSTRGFGVRADVGRLHDVPRVRIGEIRMTGARVARLTVVAAPPADDDDAPPDEAVELAFDVEIDPADSSFALLQEWLVARSVLGIVLAPSTRIIRLRSLDDLRPLTLRRIDS
jgi:hypothetical protein